MDRSSLMIMLIWSWKMSHWTAENKRPIRLWIPSIYSQDGVFSTLLAPKSGSFNNYDLRRCGKRSTRSGGTNYLTRSSLGPCRSKNGRGRRHPEALRPSQLPAVKPRRQAVRPPLTQYLAIRLHLLVVRLPEPKRNTPRSQAEPASPLLWTASQQSDQSL
jgi:hypothetical protein